MKPGRIKVTNGKITYAEHGGGTATSPSISAVGVDAPNGTYLRLDYVASVLREQGHPDLAEVFELQEL